MPNRPQRQLQSMSILVPQYSRYRGTYVVTCCESLRTFLEDRLHLINENLVFSVGTDSPHIATDTTPQTRCALGGTMIRLLAVALSRNNPILHSVQTDWCYRLGSCRTENILQHFSRPGSSYRCHPPNTFRSGRAQPAKRERLGFPENLLGAKARRTGGQKGTDCGPPPEEYPPDEHAEFRVPAP